MKVEIIKENCIGCGQCEATCSEVFKIGDDGIATIVTENIKKELEEDVNDAADACPTSAINVENA